MIQDVALVVNVVLVLVAFVGAVTGGRHIFAHVLFAVAALLVPLGCFDLSRIEVVPLSAWLYCGFYCAGHVANTVFHVARPKDNHSLGPELLVQTVGIVWCPMVRAEVDPSLWHRGTVGVVVFCTTTMFVYAVVLMVFYQSELAAHPRDDVDVLRAPLRSKSNSALLCCTPTALLVSLYVATQNLAFIGAAVGSYISIRLILPPLPRSWASETTDGNVGVKEPND
jgi:hypothetical protein